MVEGYFGKQYWSSFGFSRLVLEVSRFRSVTLLFFWLFGQSVWNEALFFLYGLQFPRDCQVPVQSWLCLCLLLHAMAVNTVPQIALIHQSKPSLCLNSQPSSLFSHFSAASNLSFGARRLKGLVAKSSMLATEVNSRSGDSNDRGLKNPIIVIDNYDSFTYNLCQYMGELGCHFEVYRNDELTVNELKRKNPRGLLISPGPGTPQDSGISLQTVLELGPTVPLFGVCMGLQCIGEAFGGKIVRSPNGVVHGKGSPVYYDEKGEDCLFSGLPNPFTAGRYHSLVIEGKSFPRDELEITAWTDDDLIMAARHRKYKHLLGVQFHPESIITSEGKIIVRNFINLIERREAESQN